MAFCEHCQGQRFDRAQVLRTLRDMKKRLGASSRTRNAERLLGEVITALRRLDIPHLEPMEDTVEGEVIH